MPTKPITPDRVRTPRQWWHARLINCGGGVLTLAVLVIGWLLYLNGHDPFLVFPIVLFVVLVIFALEVGFETSVHKAWVNRILEYNGSMCPQCAYPLTFIQEQHLNVTCPECGYLIEDACQLFERWRKSMRSFYWTDVKRLRNRKYSGPRS